MNCKVCLVEIDETTYCEICGDSGLCEDCADECAWLDAEQIQKFRDLITEISERPDAAVRLDQVEAALESIADSGEFPDEVDV